MKINRLKKPKTWISILCLIRQSFEGYHCKSLDFVNIILSAQIHSHVVLFLNFLVYFSEKWFFFYRISKYPSSSLLTTEQVETKLFLISQTVLFLIKRKFDLKLWKVLMSSSFAAFILQPNLRKYFLENSNYKTTLVLQF